MKDGSGASRFFSFAPDCCHTLTNKEHGGRPRDAAISLQPVVTLDRVTFEQQHRREADDVGAFPFDGHRCA